jgi:hypothetical protein
MQSVSLNNPLVKGALTLGTGLILGTATFHTSRWITTKICTKYINFGLPQDKEALNLSKDALNRIHKFSLTLSWLVGGFSGYKVGATLKLFAPMSTWLASMTTTAKVGNVSNSVL